MKANRNPEGIGYVLSDLDGTLRAPRQTFPSENVQVALGKLVRRTLPPQDRIYLSVATAQPPVAMKELAPRLALGRNLCVTNGGATVSRANSGKIKSRDWLSPELTCEAVVRIGDFCTRIHFNETSRAYKDPRLVVADTVAGKLATEDSPAIFAVFDPADGDVIVSLLDEMPGIGHTPVMGYHDHDDKACIQIMRPGVDKLSGAHKMIEAAKLTDKRGMAIGNDTNDLRLFEAVGPDGIKVAVNNAPIELKAKADLITHSLYGDGVVEAMHYFELI